MGVDTTGDGIKDSIAVDTTGDGRPDTVIPNPQMQQHAAAVALQSAFRGNQARQQVAGVGGYPGAPPPVQYPGGVRLSGSAGAASSSSAQPTLSQAVEILKRELRLEGNFKDVIEQAAAQLGVEPGPALAELAQQCLRQLHPGETQE